MKRHESFHPLSRDHHNVLVHARRLRGLDARFDAEAARRRFLAYAPVLLLHFNEEDLVVAPLVTDESLRSRLLAEHADLRRRIEALPSAGATELPALGEALRLHVRFEEDVLFPHLETVLAGPALRSLADDSAGFRARERPASLQGDEACFL
jgi:hypothetical protein